MIFSLYICGIFNRIFRANQNPKRILENEKTSLLFGSPPVRAADDGRRAAFGACRLRPLPPSGGRAGVHGGLDHQHRRRLVGRDRTRRRYAFLQHRTAEILSGAQRPPSDRQAPCGDGERTRTRHHLPLQGDAERRAGERRSQARHLRRGLRQRHPAAQALRGDDARPLEERGRLLGGERHARARLDPARPLQGREAPASTTSSASTAT